MKSSFTEIYRDLFYFLKKPQDQQNADQSKAQKLKALAALILLDIPLMLLLMYIIDFFAKAGWVSIDNHQMQMLIKQFPVGVIILLVVVLIPFIEEMIFRLYLRFRQNYLFRLIIICSSIAGIENTGRTEASLRDFWIRRYGIVLYFSAIIFSIVHLSNYQLSSTSFYLLPVLVLPQLILGLILGYLRVRYNFILGYFMHALHNAIFIAITLYSIN